MLSNNSIWVIIGKIVWLDYYYQRLSTYLFISFTVEIEILFWLANLNFIWNYVDKLIQEGLVSFLMDLGINRYFRWILDFNGFFFVSVKVNPAERKQRFNFDFSDGFGPDGFSWEIHQDRIHLRKKETRPKWMHVLYPQSMHRWPQTVSKYCNIGDFKRGRRWYDMLQL